MEDPDRTKNWKHCYIRSKIVFFCPFFAFVSKKVIGEVSCLKFPHTYLVSSFLLFDRRSIPCIDVFQLFFRIQFVKWRMHPKFWQKIFYRHPAHRKSVTLPHCLINTEPPNLERTGLGLRKYAVHLECRCFQKNGWKIRFWSQLSLMVFSIPIWLALRRVFTGYFSHFSPLLTKKVKFK